MNDANISNFLSSDEWEERFKPVYNEYGAPDEITPDDPRWLELVEARKVWTMLDCDGDLYVSPGVRFVNRMSYHYTELPWSSDAPDVAWYITEIEDKENSNE